MTREGHLKWCKERALEYLDAGDLQNAVASMGSDLSKHPETEYPADLIQVAIGYILSHDAESIRRWINGFH